MNQCQQALSDCSKFWASDLTPDQIDYWNAQAVPLRLTGINLFQRYNYEWFLAALGTRNLTRKPGYPGTPSTWKTYRNYWYTFGPPNVLTCEMEIDVDRAFYPDGYLVSAQTNLSNQVSWTHLIWPDAFGKGEAFFAYGHDVSAATEVHLRYAPMFAGFPPQRKTNETAPVVPF